jgi:agmatinase
MPRYGPVDALQSPRFCGVRTFARLPLVQDLADVDLAFVGSPFDTGVTFRVGARFGPAAIREASLLLRPYHPGLHVDVFSALSAVDYGDLPVVPGYIEDSYARVEAGLAPLLAAGITPIILGGDHSITLAHLRAVARAHGPLGLAQFDAHSDTWDAYFGRKYTHGTTFKRAVEEGLLDPARGIQVGMRGPLYAAEDYDTARALGLDLMPASEVREVGIQATVQRIRERLGGGAAFISFDVDFLDPAYAPGTGTPEVGGFTTYEAQQLIRGLAGLRLVAYDVVEVLPAYDHGDITALAAANVAYEFAALTAMQKNERTAQGTTRP